MGVYVFIDFVFFVELSIVVFRSNLEKNLRWIIFEVNISIGFKVNGKIFLLIKMLVCKVEERNG